MYILSYEITDRRLFSLLLASALCFGLYYAMLNIFILLLLFFLLRKLTRLVFVSYLVPCIFCFQCLSRRFLKEFSVPANTVWDGKLFQLFVILFLYISMIFKATLCSLLEVRKVVNSKPERTLERLSHNLLHPHPPRLNPPLRFPTMTPMRKYCLNQMLGVGAALPVWYACMSTP